MRNMRLARVWRRRPLAHLADGTLVPSVRLPEPGCGDARRGTRRVRPGMCWDELAVDGVFAREAEYCWHGALGVCTERTCHSHTHHWVATPRLSRHVVSPRLRVHGTASRHGRLRERQSFASGAGAAIVSWARRTARDWTCAGMVRHGRATTKSLSNAGRRQRLGI